MVKILFYVSACFLFITTTNTIAAGDPVAGSKKSAVCAACHGADGNSAIPAWPSIAGQNEEYTYKQLLDFKSNKRDNPQMSPILAVMSDQELADISAYFASQKAKPASTKLRIMIDGEERSASLDSAEYMYRFGNPDTGLAACMACHGPNGNGNPAARFPAINGQHAEYTATTLKAYKSEVRNNDPNKIMRNIASKLSNAEIDIIANYLQGLH